MRHFSAEMDLIGGEIEGRKMSRRSRPRFKKPGGRLAAAGYLGNACSDWLEISLEYVAKRVFTCVGLANHRIEHRAAQSINLDTRGVLSFRADRAQSFSCRLPADVLNKDGGVAF